MNTPRRQPAGAGAVLRCGTTFTVDFALATSSTVGHLRVQMKSILAFAKAFACMIFDARRAVAARMHHGPPRGRNLGQVERRFHRRIASANHGGGRPLEEVAVARGEVETPCPDSCD